jgi:adenosine deaminase
MTVGLNDQTILQAPKVLLHDHLDGGVRPATVIELAQEIGYRGLPTTDVGELANWFTQGAFRNSLELYLEGFSHTVAVMQTKEALTRVAAECAEDLAADGVVYAEIRFAPELHVARGLSLEEVVTAVLTGLDQGAQRAAARGHFIVIGALLCAMRQVEAGDPPTTHESPSVRRESLRNAVERAGGQHLSESGLIRSLHIADLAIRYRDAGVLGFDIAGPEAGYEPKRHIEAFNLIHRNNGFVTIHAGEAFGLPSIKQALQTCGAHRLGHGVRIVDDISVDPDGGVKMGRLAAYVRDARVPLELCPTSNVHTGVVSRIEDHPISLLAQLRYRVTINTDNRLMSGVSMSSEMRAVSDAFGYGLGELEWFTINAMKSAFLSFDHRLQLINNVIKPGYAKLRAQMTGNPDRQPLQLNGPAADVLRTGINHWGLAKAPYFIADARDLGVGRPDIELPNLRLPEQGVEDDTLTL